MVCACRPDRRRHSLRVGVLPNLTHAVPIVAFSRGLLTGNDGRPVELVPFNDGPTAVEALLAGDLDLAYCGPGPAINAFVRTRGRVRVLSGAASGGASFILRSGVEIRQPSDLERRKIATPQTGNTQDIALRSWLVAHDLDSTDRGGKVMVVPMTNSQTLSLFQSKQIDGAWVPEPWATRLLREANGHLFVDEATLWPEGRFPTTVLITSSKMLRDRTADVRAIVRGNRQAVAWINRNPAAAQKIVNDFLEKQTGKKLPDALLATSWKHLEFTDDPLPGPLKEIARASRRIGYTPSADLHGLVVEPAELLPARVSVQEETPR